MTLRKRIILIVCGIAIFASAAPAIVFLARGYSFDFKNFRIVSTGILSVKSEPKGAEIIVDGRLKDKSPAAIRFLTAGEYEVILKKAGFVSWKKRVAVHEHLVTNIPEKSGSKVFLFLEAKIQTTVSTNTKDLLANGDGFFFLENEKVYRFNFDGNTKKFVTTTTETLISSQVNSSPKENFYYLNGNELLQKNQTSATTTLTQNLPNYSSAQIVPAAIHPPFLILDRKLYEIGEGLRKLSNGADYAFWQAESKTLIFGNEHEIWLYEPDGQAESQLVTRSSKILGIPAYSPLTGYVFVSEGKEIKAIETDDSGQANVYMLTETLHDNVKLASNPDGTHLLYLDGPNLYTLKIR